MFKWNTWISCTMNWNDINLWYCDRKCIVIEVGFMGYCRRFGLWANCKIIFFMPFLYSWFNSKVTLIYSGISFIVTQSWSLFIIIIFSSRTSLAEHRPPPKSNKITGYYWPASRGSLEKILIEPLLIGNSAWTDDLTQIQILYLL